MLKMQLFDNYLNPRFTLVWIQNQILTLTANLKKSKMFTTYLVPKCWQHKLLALLFTLSSLQIFVYSSIFFLRFLSEEIVLLAAGIGTRIVRVGGKHVDHLTTTNMVKDMDWNFLMVWPTYRLVWEATILGRKLKC